MTLPVSLKTPDLRQILSDLALPQSLLHEKREVLAGAIQDEIAHLHETIIENNRVVSDLKAKLTAKETLGFLREQQLQAQSDDLALIVEALGVKASDLVNKTTPGGVRGVVLDRINQLRVLEGR